MKGLAPWSMYIGTDRLITRELHSNTSNYMHRYITYSNLPLTISSLKQIIKSLCIVKFNKMATCIVLVFHGCHHTDSHS